VDKAPHQFKDAEQYQRSMRMPIGNAQPLKASWLYLNTFSNMPVLTCLFAQGYSQNCPLECHSRTKKREREMEREKGRFERKRRCFERGQARFRSMCVSLFVRKPNACVKELKIVFEYLPQNVFSANLCLCERVIKACLFF